MRNFNNPEQHYRICVVAADSDEDMELRNAHRGFVGREFYETSGRKLIIYDIKSPNHQDRLRPPLFTIHNGRIK